ncbi:hypothetical protein Gbro_0536 [Gordonia bronchialis DSM 43247]|uniref:Eco29kI family restriction endonuclease n=1 Tax=Gordonia bronchialis (strain ATCC 25592 / DSM 43247 / BCRC 13721 / JCM 3198 / KCTC 3076 / NBRC 16047 / NCTC 10667) TaxID=526226 RepID=D0LEE8_GORB4|nr:Eco29kI family restriction endonuclease [Gordonia bronchialis]ACY19866.1 hypothetical protein Gbro_0536 [Gordonia bronchialis DSM 43247]MCC3322638.1 Eco29kI family restriction endonuclease [Gordonia bronchialis]QGS26266.1 Eco29kI family restriction endonuclease [Gordonia bronchialis]STQ62643.1 Eco29kI restriction endonuclease [Gordonia bronchialis]
MGRKNLTKTAAIQELIDALNSAVTLSGQLDGWDAPVKNDRAAIVAARDHLIRTVDGQLYRHEMPAGVFNPADPGLFGLVAAVGLVHQDLEPLNDIVKTYGSGVYALYYRGDNDLYRPLLGTQTPIYVGKTKTPTSGVLVEQGVALTDRLTKHFKSIGWGHGLDVDDFDYRRLVIAPGWEPVTEGALINLFRPVWNKRAASKDPVTGRAVRYVHGFGKNGDDADTRNNGRSPWDTLHPGRPWANDKDPTRPTKNQMERAEIEALIAKHFADNPPIAKADDVVKRLVDSMTRGEAPPIVEDDEDES